MIQVARAKDKAAKAAEKEARSKRLTVSGLAARWVEFSHRRLALTGTPFPQHPWDAFGIYRALDPGVFGLVFEPFKNKFLQMDRSGNFPVKVLPGMLSEFATLATSLMYRPAVDLNLPGYTDVLREIELEDTARRAYDEIEATFETDLRRWLAGEIDDLPLRADTAGLDADSGGEAGEVHDIVNGGTTKLTEHNLLSVLLRLQQLTGGTLRPDDDTAPDGRRLRGQDVRLSTAKTDQLAEFTAGKLTGGDLFDIGCVPGRRTEHGTELLPEPCIVYCRFKSDLDAVQEVVEKAGLRYGEVSGRRSDGLNDDARMSEHIDVVGVQIQAGGTGVDLTRAAYGIWYSLGYSVSDYDQARARPYRPGQTRPVTFIHYVAVKTKDVAVYDAIRQRKAAVAAVMRAGGIDPAAIGIVESDPGPDPNAAPIDGQDSARSAVPLPWER